MTDHRLAAPVDHTSATRPLLRVTEFLVITYLVTWSCFTAASRVATGAQLPLLLAGSFAPSVVGTLLTWHHDGGRAARRLLARLLQWRVGVRWYVFALGFFAVVKLVAAAGYRAGTGHWPTFGATPWYAVLAAIVVSGIVGGPLGEEVGWRGYALPRLTERFGAASAALVLGVVWACWHLPLFVLPGLGAFTDQHGQSFPSYLIQVTALSVALAWLMNRTGGSLLLAVVMHSAINQTKDLVSSRVPGADDPWALSHSPIAWLTAAVLWVAATWLLVRLHRAERRE
jgi:membrane protease YdiL (CAAX protease family)